MNPSETDCPVDNARVAEMAADSLSKDTTRQLRYALGSSSVAPAIATGAATAHGAPDAAGLKRQAMLLAVACAAAAVLCLVLWNSGRSRAATLDLHDTRTTRLAADARAIVALRERPHHASEAGLPQSDLLEQVAAAMRTAGLDAQTLASTLPQPPRHQPGSDLAEVTHRLLLENADLEALTRFCHSLTTANPKLHISALQLRAAAETAAWNADVSVSYWLLVSVPKSAHVTRRPL